MKNRNLSSSQLYTPADFFMIRTPALPASIFTSIAETSNGTEEGSKEESYRRILKIAQSPQVEQALAVASNALPSALQRLREGTLPEGRIRRTYASLMRYLIRMSTRPTPFGLFAGVAVGQFADKTAVQLAQPTTKRFRTRPDMQWLQALIQSIEEQPELVAQLQVSVNPLLYRTGERIVLLNIDHSNEQALQVVSLRATSIVNAVLERAKTPITYAHLQTKICQAFPQATSEQIRHLLWQLWKHHILMSNMHPPLTNARPADYVYDKIATLQGADEVKEILHTLLLQLAQLDINAQDMSVSRIITLLEAQQSFKPIKDQDQPAIQIDMALNLRTCSLQRNIAMAAAQAAELLLRLTSRPQGIPHLTEYRMHFLEKYGLNAEVSLLDLLSSENGLDAPTNYIQPPRTYPLPHPLAQTNSTTRDRYIQQIIAEAINERSSEVELTAERLHYLESWSPQLQHAPLSLELYLQIQAESQDALDQGHWSAIIGPGCGSPAIGRTFGRFFDLLEDPAMAQLQQMIEREEALEPDTIFAELSYQPRYARTANVTIRPALRKYEIVVGTTSTVPDERVLPLNDLVVGVDNGSFYLRSLHLGKRVIVSQSHMLNMQLAPNICRFITEIAHDGRPVLRSFDWGSADHSPFLPRLVYKSGPTAHIVLSVAQWNIQTTTITPRGEGSTRERWFQGMQHWRAYWRVPRYVYLTTADNRLLLDLEQPLMSEELQNAIAQLKENQQVTVQEVYPDLEHLWVKDEQGERYFAEIVVPLLRSDAFEKEHYSSAPERAKGEQIKPREQVLLHRERCFLPGDEWIYFKLYVALKQHNAIIAGPLHQLLQVLRERDLIDRWFFLRYIDEEPHLRLRFHACEQAQVQPLLAVVMQWSRQLVSQGRIQYYSIDTYQREVERYGGPAAITLLEQVFSIDSDICSNYIAAYSTHQLILDPLAVAAFSLDHLFTIWSVDFEKRLQWTQRHTHKYALVKEFRSLRHLYTELFLPWDQQPLPEIRQQRDLLLSLLQPFDIPLQEVAEQVQKLHSSGKLWVTADSLLDSIAHMHKVRLLGLDLYKEQQLYAFWYQTLESLRLRPR